MVAAAYAAAAARVAGAPAADELAPVMVVLDASGSMRGAAGGGTDKMTAAKRAVGALVREAPAGARLGLTVYGTGTGNAPADKAKGCQDVRVARQVGPLDGPAFLAAVDGVKARGYTPIGRALRVAASALPPGGPRAIVLVSDGIDSCAPPDPCDVARELAETGLDLRVHAIGFDVDAAAQRQLTCLAQATGGTYAAAPDAAALGRALNRVTRRALRGYEPAGTPVTGTPQQRGAPVLGAGAYLDQIARDQEKYYALDVPAGWTLHATAIVVDTAAPTGGLLRVTRFAADGTECDWAERAKEPDAPMTAAVLTWAAPGSARPDPRPCQTVGPMAVRISLRGGSVTGERALELLVALEPPVDGDPGARPAGPVTFGPAARRATTAVVGGGSFGAAATLDGGGSYTDTVQPGEFLFYRVRLDWGQGVAVRLDADRDLRPTLYGADRDQLTGAATWPVRYRNRDEVADGGRPQSLAGWYYLSVWNRGDTPSPVTIDLAVVGEREVPPPYEGGRDAFGVTQAPVVTPEPPAAVVTSAPTVATPAAAGRPVTRWWWISVPLVIALLVVGLLTRRRARR